MILNVFRSACLLLPLTAGLMVAERASFEVASIKPGDPADHRTMIQMAPGGSFSAKNLSVKQLIMQAYRVRDFQITGGPSWIGTERFDITAKGSGSGDIPDEQFREMLQSLLADRFHVALKRDTKDLPAYLLVIAKGGPKLKKSEPVPPAGDGDGPPPAGPGGRRGGRGMVRMGRGSLDVQGADLSLFVTQLSNQLGRPVIDKTGLTGSYDFKLEWTPDTQAPGPRDADAAPAVDSSGPTVFTAIQEQLGLKLESTHGPVEILIVEKAEKPTEN